MNNFIKPAQCPVCGNSRHHVANCPIEQYDYHLNDLEKRLFNALIDTRLDEAQIHITSLEAALSERDARLTELQQRLASKEDALAAALLVIDSGSKRVAELETDRDKVANECLMALAGTACTPVEGYVKAGMHWIASDIKSLVKAHKELESLADKMGSGWALVEYEKLQADSRQLAAAVVESHTGTSMKEVGVNVDALVNGDFGYHCQCPACQTARRVLTP